jgi:hypothetical protein
VLSGATLARLPADATLAAARTCHPAEWLALLAAVNPDARAELEQGFERSTGVRLAEDLLAHLGPAAGGFVSASSGGGLLSGVLFVETGESAALSATMARLLAALAEELGGERLALREFEHGGVRCTALAFPGLPIPAEPSYAVAGGALYVALSSASLREALDQLAAHGSILDHPELRAAEGRSEGLHGLAFFDAPYYVKAGYARVAQFTPMVENLARGMGREISPLLPALPALIKGSRAWVSRSWFEGDELVRVTSFDRSLAASIVAIGGSPPFQGLGIASAVAIPQLMSARLTANESAAIASLRHMASAQAQFQAFGIADADGDGIGEYGFPGELTGTTPVRGTSAPLDPPVLSTRMVPTDDGTGRGVIQRSGYVFQVWVGTQRGGAVVGMAEPLGRVTPGRGPTADAAEIFWCCYAWPLHPGNTGNRSFFINQEGDVLVLEDVGRYHGLPGQGGAAPSFDAAYTLAGDLSAPLAIGERGVDGAVWTILGLD